MPRQAHPPLIAPGFIPPWSGKHPSLSMSPLRQGEAITWSLNRKHVLPCLSVNGSLAKAPSPAIAQTVCPFSHSSYFLHRNPHPDGSCLRPFLFFGRLPRFLSCPEETRSHPVLRILQRATNEVKYSHKIRLWMPVNVAPDRPRHKCLLHRVPLIPPPHWVRARKSPTHRQTSCIAA